MPRLRVLAGPGPTRLTPITHQVNSNTPHPIASDAFVGQVVVFVKGFDGADGGGNDGGSYFDREDRMGVTWSIQVQGRFLQPCSADDILFGNTFDRPLKLPWGSGAAFKFMKYIDPTLEHNLSSQTKPWALSPLISTMPHFVHTRLVSSPSPSPSPSHGGSTPPIFPPAHSIADDTSQLHYALVRTSSSPSSSSSSSSSSSLSLSSSSESSPKSSSSSSSSSSRKSIISKTKSKIKQRTTALKASPSPLPSHSPTTRKLSLPTATDRRTYFSDAQNRKDVVFGPNDVLTTDFCYGFLEFNPRLALRLPGGLSFDLMRYWDGQPVRFVCCSRAGRDAGVEGNGGGDGDGEPWDKMFWCVTIELEDSEEDEEDLA